MSRPTDPNQPHPPVLDYRPPSDEGPNQSLAELVIVRLVAAAAAVFFVLIVPPFIRNEAASYVDTSHPIPAYCLTFGGAAWFAWVALGCPLARRNPGKPPHPPTDTATTSSTSKTASHTSANSSTPTPR